MDKLNDLLIEYQTNKVRNVDKPIHDWYRFVLSFPPHLVKHYLDKFDLGKDSTILDPFCGTGTTLVESKLNSFKSIGIEANPVIRFAAKTKLNWDIDTDQLIDTSLDIINKVNKCLNKEGINDFNLESKSNIELLKLPIDSEKILLKNSISPLPLHKALVLLNEIKRHKNDQVRDHLLLGFLKTVIKDLSNLRFGPEVGVGKIKDDARLLEPWAKNINIIAQDIERQNLNINNISAEVILGDSRNSNQYLTPSSVKAVITSPPYPNEKDYSRTTRLESVLLGLINNNDELRGIKKTFVRSNTRSVYKDDKDHKYIEEIASVKAIAKEIEARRIELNKTSGFEKMYSKVTLQYFGGMARHLSNLRHSLEPGAKLAYVVGDQASYLRVMIRTGQILGEIAESLGYKVTDLELFRTRFATSSKELLREEVLLLEWEGINGNK